MISRLLPLIVLLLFVSCTDIRPDVLVQLDGAKEVESFRLNGMDVLQYELQAKYPAQEHIDQVRKKLQKDGWKPLDYTFLYPKYASSHVTGWTYFNDPPRNPSIMIYEWSADWQDGQGNVVTYTFRYHDPIEKYKKSVFTLEPGNRRMEVTAIYMPSTVARSKQRQMNPDKSYYTTADERGSDGFLRTLPTSKATHGLID